MTLNHLIKKAEEEFEILAGAVDERGNLIRPDIAEPLKFLFSQSIREAVEEAFKETKAKMGKTWYVPDEVWKNGFHSALSEVARKQKDYLK